MVGPGSRRIVDQILEELCISLLSLTSLVSQILLQLLNIGGHLLRIRNTLIQGVTVNLDDILEETDQSLGICLHMIDQQIQTIIAVNGSDHDNAVHAGIFSLKRYTGPLAQNLIGLHHGIFGKIHKLDIY